MFDLDKQPHGAGPEQTSFHASWGRRLHRLAP